MFNIKRIPFLLTIAGLLLSPLVAANFSSACSRILWNTNKQAVVVARSMDFNHPFGDRIVIYPRGMRMEGMHGMPGEKNSANWVSKYGSVGVVTYGLNKSILKRLEGQVDPADLDDPLVTGNTEGINEKGLAAHVLTLRASNYGARDPKKPGVFTYKWVRYVLDNYATVKEAIDGLQSVQLVCLKLFNVEYPQHMAIEDATGDSAIIEVVDGKMVVHHGREYTVMTNDPPYPQQLENLKRYKLFGGAIEELPGGCESPHRFVRASEFLRTLPEPKDQPEAVAYLFGVIRNVSSPFGALYHSLPERPTSPTWWISATDLTNRTFYFGFTHNLNILRVSLKDIDFSAGKPMSVLDPAQTDLAGDVTKKFAPVPAKK